MALHRDIFWIGRQWAVTGHGMQLIDQRLMGAFDIEAARLWDDELIGRMRAKEWLNAADFDKGLAVARTRHPREQAVSTSVVVPPVPAIESVEPPLPAANPEAPKFETPKQESPDLQMKIDGGAKFARPWRVWMKKT
ncbi:hypothetical protein [Bradyrhizobium sp. AZCC 1693]|uniref:hypothetical protein n=1 Tax=Bradyrhizobium sp. AZCC 1693 TaxID=3117029 RepID=UPI002FF39491